MSFVRLFVRSLFVLPSSPFPCSFFVLLFILIVIGGIMQFISLFSRLVQFHNCLFRFVCSLFVLFCIFVLFILRISILSELSIFVGFIDFVSRKWENRHLKMIQLQKQKHLKIRRQERKMTNNSNNQRNTNKVKWTNRILQSSNQNRLKKQRMWRTVNNLCWDEITLNLSWHFVNWRSQQPRIRLWLSNFFFLLFFLHSFFCVLTKERKS